MSASESEHTTASDSQTPEISAGGNGHGEAGDNAGEPPVALHAHHVSKLLDEVLEEPIESPSGRRFRHPMILDIFLGVGLLVAMGGFTIGLFKMYVVHSAQQSIYQHNYKAAIGMLKGVPAPGLFSIPGADPEEMLNQALYLDAMDKLEVENDTEGALRQLQQVRPGSRYFTLAQEIIDENFTPSSTTLHAGASITEEAAPPPKQKRKLYEDQQQDAVP